MNKNEIYSLLSECVEEILEENVSSELEDLLEVAQDMINEAETEEEADAIVEAVETLIESGVLKLKKGIEYEDTKQLEADLIDYAKDNQFKDKDYRSWSKTDSKEESEKNYDSIKDLKLGFCYRDPNNNYLVYSLTKKKFYFFDNEKTAVENIKDGAKDINWIEKKIETTLADYKESKIKYKQVGPIKIRKMSNHALEKELREKYGVIDVDNKNEIRKKLGSDYEEYEDLLHERDRKIWKAIRMSGNYSMHRVFY